MIVLTGGAGFIGSCFLKKLNDNGIKDIIIVDHLGNKEKWKNLVGKRFLKFVHKDEFLKSVSRYEYAEDRIDAIINLGACTVTTERNADYIIANNLNYSIDLAKYALKKHIRYIYASSAATYGNGENGYSDYDFDKLRPLNAYGLSKHLFDLWVRDNDLENVFTGLKFFNVFGPNEYHKADMASMVFKSFKQIKKTGRVKLFRSNHPDYEDGGQMRDFIYVKDVIECIWNIYRKPNFAGIYNLGTGKARTWNDLVNAVFQAMNIKPEIEYIDMPDSLVKQYQNYTQADMKKLNDSECKMDFMTLEESIKDYVQNHLMKEWMYY